MKPLKRPMFRSGGPIKEGIMDGMQDRPQQLVQPAADGSRPGYAGPLALLGTLFGTTATRAAAPTVIRSAPGIFSRIKNIFSTPVTKTVPKQGPTGIGLKVTKDPITGGPMTRETIKLTPGSGELTTRQLKPYFANDPTIRLVRGTFNALTDPKAKSLFAKGVRFVASPTGVLTGGYFAAGKFFDSEGNEISKDKANELGLTAGDKIDEKVITGESDGTGDKTLTRDAEIEANRKRYYKLMGIDKLNKQAAYNTLIDASNQIREGGNIKDQLKSGSLASSVINALSKNLDSSVDLKKQIDAAILKGEITKDINKEKNQSEAELRELQKKVYQKKLDGADLDDIAAEYRKSQLPLKGQTLYTEANRAGVDSRGILPTKDVDEFLNDNPTLTEADFVKQYQEKLVKNGQPILEEGNYIVGGRIVHISDGGLVDRFVF
tara:strand:+ start:491 stop:1795 length:1305 start_codon:yes stop_codon:yes gene_type:complete